MGLIDLLKILTLSILGLDCLFPALIRFFLQGDRVLMRFRKAIAWVDPSFRDKYFGIVASIVTGYFVLSIPRQS